MTNLEHGEKDLEAVILCEIEYFLLEMGSGFCFVARQKRMSVGNDDFYLDLLFYHRHLLGLATMELITNAALIINRLHPRGKSAERERQANDGKALRPIDDLDAETSVHLIGLILRDIGWAAP